MKSETRVKYGLIAACIIGAVLLLELGSALLLHTVVHSTRLERFDEIYSRTLYEYDLKPHPYLKFVQGHYTAEKERFLEYLGEENQIPAGAESDNIYIVALGGSTTQLGYPNYTQAYLNRRLDAIGSDKEVVVFNFGVHGWSSFQSVQNYFYLLKYIHPDYIVIHHNHNEGQYEHFFSENGVEYFPEISRFERGLVRCSRFYKLVKFTYLLVYDSVRYGDDVRYFDILDGPEKDYPPAARISGYINEKDPFSFIPLFFERDFVNLTYPSRGITGEFILTENYESLIMYARADGAKIVMTTQYQNFSKAAPGKFPDPGGNDPRDAATAMNDGSRRTNVILRNIAEKNNAPFVDLERDMEQYDHLLIEECHFWEEGVEIQGELIGAEVWKLMKEEYGFIDVESMAPRPNPVIPVVEPTLEIAEVLSVPELDDVLVIDDFEHGDIGGYVQDPYNAEMDVSIVDVADIGGKALELSYVLTEGQEHSAVDLAWKFVLDKGVQDWSEYTYLNLLFRAERDTTILRAVVLELDGDWWNYQNEPAFSGAAWYHLRIPLRGMSIDPDFSIQGDNLQDLTSVAELRLIFDNANLEGNPAENTVFVDHVFLSEI